MGGGRNYGHVAGQPVNKAYPNRRALVDVYLHRPPMAGIWGGADGAESVVVSGGYSDDVDYGDVIIYTGEGGNDPATGHQVADQTLTKGNLGLAVSCNEGFPVRVIRGSNGDKTHSPAVGFRYDGLFRVADYWHATGLDGFRIWRYRLEKLPDGDWPAQAEDGDVPPGTPTPARKAVMVQRVVRNTAVAEWVKSIHGHACQICGAVLSTPAGPYAEGAHIRALGRPHDGPDVASNILCLCPNDHVMFDSGGLVIEADLTIRMADGSERGHLRTHAKHELDLDQITYHRKAHGA